MHKFYPSEEYVLGLDLGIKTGSLVRVKVNHEYNLPEFWEPLLTWTRGPSIKDPLDNIMEFFYREVFGWINFDIAHAIAIDWNRNEINWSANRNHSNIKTFVAGAIYSLSASQGMICRFVAPAEVRTFLGFSTSKVSKTEVHRKFLSTPIIHNGVSDDRPRPQDHDLDAIILAYILDLKLRAETYPLLDKEVWRY